MSVPLQDVAALWSLPVDDFNEWRATNDLRILFAFFGERLPGFSDWLAAYQLSEDDFCATLPTGMLFKDLGHRVLWRFPGNLHWRPSSFTAQDLTEQAARHREPTPEIKPYVPYFAWAKQTLGNRRFIVEDALNDSVTDTFVYNAWSAVRRPDISRASLFKDFDVLKLGGIRLPGDALVGGRNLDFADLDFLEVEGDLHPARHTYVCYSSCRDLLLDGTELAFWDFIGSQVESLTCRSSRLQNFSFIDSHVSGATFASSRLVELKVEGSHFSAEFDNCDLARLHYRPPSTGHFDSIAQTCRSFRTAFQARGKRYEAGQFYYLERTYERKGLFSPYLANRHSFPGRVPPRLRDYLVRFWRHRPFTWRQALHEVWQVLVFHVKLWISPRSAWRAAGYKLRYLGSLIEGAVWGYGERPIRVLSTALLIILLYAIAFHQWTSWETAESDLSWVDSAYLSAITFTTLGYGDITPKTSVMKLLCASEALIGAFILGLVIAGFSNRSRY